MPPETKKSPLLIVVTISLLLGMLGFGLYKGYDQIKPWGNPLRFSVEELVDLLYISEDAEFFNIIKSKYDDLGELQTEPEFRYVEGRKFIFSIHYNIQMYDYYSIAFQKPKHYYQFLNYIDKRFMKSNEAGAYSLSEEVNARFINPTDSLLGEVTIHFKQP